MNLAEAIAVLERAVPSPSQGLPDEVFYYISRTTPMVNVDLLIQDDKKRTLLAWRDDPLAGKGWHLPGGIIRFKETFAQRVQKVAQTEVGVEQIEFDPVPLAVNEIILKDFDDRGHFISILYRCWLPAGFKPENKGRSPRDVGFLAWHESPPADLLKLQDFYRKFL